MVRILAWIPVIVLALASTSCGNKKAGETAKAVSAIFSASQSSLQAAKQIADARVTEFKELARLGRLDAAGFASTTFSNACNGTVGQSSGTVSCTFDSTSVPCGGTTYTVTGSFTMTYSYDSSSRVYTLGFNFNMTINGGEFENTRVEVVMNISFDLDDASSDTGFEPQCGSNFTVKIDGEDVSCDDMKEEFNSSDNRCA